MALVRPGRAAPAQVDRSVEVSLGRASLHGDRTHAKHEALRSELAVRAPQTLDHAVRPTGGERGGGGVVAGLPGQQEILDARGHRRIGLADAGHPDGDHHYRRTDQRPDPDPGTPRSKNAFPRPIGRPGRSRHVSRTGSRRCGPWARPGRRKAPQGSRSRGALARSGRRGSLARPWRRAPLARPRRHGPRTRFRLGGPRRWPQAREACRAAPKCVGHGLPRASGSARSRRNGLGTGQSAGRTVLASSLRG